MKTFDLFRVRNGFVMNVDILTSWAGSLLWWDNSPCLFRLHLMSKTAYDDSVWVDVFEVAFLCFSLNLRYREA
jgi:hypothetical protein